jgi:hypothetical protein
LIRPDTPVSVDKADLHERATTYVGGHRVLELKPFGVEKADVETAYSLRRGGSHESIATRWPPMKLHRPVTRA